MDTSISLNTVFLIVIIIQMGLISLFFYRLFYKRTWIFQIGETSKNQGEPKSPRAKSKKPREKYSSSGLSNELVEDFGEKMMHIIENEKTYLNPNLKLSDVAKRIGLSNNQTSQVINQSFGKDFNSFINEFRIKEAAFLLEQNRHTAITEIIYQVGFNNKVTFNKAFRKSFGCTPREYMGKHFHLN